MPYDQLSENARLIVAEIKDIIIRKPTKGISKAGGWEYSNQELSAAVARLENELNQVDFEVSIIRTTHVLLLTLEFRLLRLMCSILFMPEIFITLYLTSF